MHIKNNIKFRFLATGFFNTLFGIVLGYLFISMLPFHYSMSLLSAQVLGVILSLMFVVYSIINLSQLDSETDANFVIKRGILITSSIIFGLSACAGIVTLLISKRQKKS